MQRLLARLPQSHPQHAIITNKLYQSRSGYAGELTIDRILNQIELPEGTAILKDLTMEINPDFLVQIDTLILTPSIAFLLEIKNYAGTIQFNETTGKTTKIAPTGEIDKYDCIIHQLDRATQALNQWFTKRNIQLPIEPILIMANQRTNIPEFPSAIQLKYGKQLPRHIRTKLADHNPETQHTPKQLQAIATSIHNNRIRWKRKPACERYKIDPTELKRGVLCLTCHTPMPRKQRQSWACPNCTTPNKQAIDQAVADWYLLVSPTVTNKQLRHFLNLNSSAATSLIFQQMRLQKGGNRRGPIYTWDYKPPIRK